MSNENKECCTTCARYFKGKKSDYSKGGCKDSDMDGFICMCFADEDIAVWMTGIGQNEQCEMYTPKGEYKLTWKKNIPKT